MADEHSHNSDATKNLVSQLLQSSSNQGQPSDEETGSTYQTFDSSMAEEEVPIDENVVRLQQLLPFPETMDVTEDDDNEALYNIELFFDSDDPVERDLIMEQLAGNPSAHAKEFFESALNEDPDPFIRAQAAEALCRRGVAAGIESLYATLADPELLELFSHAVLVLTHVQGESFFDVVKSIWLDSQRSYELKKEAMLSMEQIDPEKCKQELLQFVSQITSVDNLPEDELAMVMNSLVRLEASEVVPMLQNIYQLIKDSDIDPVETQLIEEELLSTIHVFTIE